MKNSQTAQEILEQEILEIQEALKAKRALKKELTKKDKKPLKGVPVRFTNKAGETIEGLGVLYYVVNLNGKLHYKQIDSVEVL